MVGLFFEGQTLSVTKLLGIGCTVVGTLMVILVGYRFREKHTTQFLERFEVGLALGGLTSIFWSLNTFAVARGGRDLSPHVSNLVRMAIALVLCPVVGFLLHRKWRAGISWRAVQPFAGVFVLEAFGGSFFFMYGLTHAPLAIASALSSLAPVIAVAAAWFFGSERVSALKALGVSLAVAVAILLVS